MAEASLNYSITLHLDLNLRNRCNLWDALIPQIYQKFTSSSRTSLATCL